MGQYSDQGWSAGCAPYGNTGGLAELFFPASDLTGGHLDEQLATPHYCWYNWTRDPVVYFLLKIPLGEDWRLGMGAQS